MQIGLAQIDKTWNDPAANIARCRKLLDEAQQKHVELVVFPEMFTTGFSQVTGEKAKEANRIGVEFLKSDAANRNMHLCGSLPDPCKDAERPMNTLYFFGPTGELAKYSKLYLFKYQGEDKTYQAGTELVTVEALGFRISLFICYDLRFPMAFYQLAPKTDLYLLVANWPDSRQLHFETLLRARAIENQAFVAGVNRVGQSENGLSYGGGSQIISPLGEIIARGESSECLVTAEIAAETVNQVRKDFPFLQDRLD